MIRKLLIANRGEIAVRIIRTCRDLGIATVAVYSEADRGARHVRMADEAYLIGGAPPQDSYLRIDRVMDAARKSGADALHPGYGFLSENPALAEACDESGIVFVGPAATTLRRIGEKTSARSIAAAVGVAIVPGTTSPARSIEELRAAVENVGYPILIKAAAGGGGKGMRLVEAAAELEDAYRSATNEATTAFGDGSVYVERFVERPRHVEVQFLGYPGGAIVCLGERDCSIQRRHQKLIEETPSPAVGPELRAALFDAATRAARAVDYLNAGTAEFLVDERGNHYFLEVNARLQVEHPVTEEATGLDLVREQLRIAAGERVDTAGLRSLAGRAAIECRIYAEDPYNGFLPSTGTIDVLQQPGGPGVRVESASYPGMEVGLHYDPLLAKLVAWGATREEAIGRMRRALREYVVLGVRTSIPFHRFAMENEAFLKGSYDTSFVQRWEAAAPAHDDLAPLAAVAAAVLAARRNGRPWAGASGGNGTSSNGGASSAWGLAARRAALRGG